MYFTSIPTLRVDVFFFTLYGYCSWHVLFEPDFEMICITGASLFLFSPSSNLAFVAMQLIQSNAKETILFLLEKA